MKELIEYIKKKLEGYRKNPRLWEGDIKNMEEILKVLENIKKWKHEKNLKKEVIFLLGLS